MNTPDKDNLKFDDMIRARTKQWADEYDEANRMRIAEHITLTMRNRGDYFGYFYNRSHISSQWRPFTGAGMVTYPVIGRSIRSKIATSVGTRIQTEVEAVRSVPEKQAAAELARNILKFLRSQHRTKQLETSIAELGQLARFSFIHNSYKETGGMILQVPVTRQEEKKFGTTEYVCSACGFIYTPEDLGADDIADEFKDKDLSESSGETAEMTSQPAQPKQLNPGEMSSAEQIPEQMPADRSDEYLGEIETEDEFLGSDEQLILNHTANLACPQCQTNTLVLENRAKYERIDALTGEYRTVDTGTFECRVVNPLQIRIDTYKSIGFDYKKADWFNYHPLVPAYEILAIAPQMKEKLETGANRWSESSRWHYELDKNTSSGAGYSYKEKNYRLDELVEVNCWWIAPHACFGWNSPEEYELEQFTIDASGELQKTGAAFTIAIGETIEAATKRQFGGEFRGLLVVMCDDELIGIGNEHFTEKWVGVPWKVDSQSFYPAGEENLLKLQDAATNVLSMWYAYIRRFGTAPLVVNEMMFDMESVANWNQPGNVIKINRSLPENENADWKRNIGFLEPGNFSTATAQMVQMIIDIAKEESGVFNETVGNVESNNETLGGRQIALSQSMSLMTPTQQGKAQAFLEQEYLWLELWQRYAPTEAFQLIKGTFEEEWKPQDIEAFKALNIRQELFITIVEGTDIPKTQSEMEQRFMIAVQMGLFQEPNPLPIQIRSHIVKSVLGIDFDLQNYSAFKRLAARRFDVMKEALEGIEPNEAFMVAMDPSGFPIQQLRPELVAAIAQDATSKPRGTDEHLVFIEYYTDKINGLAGAKEPDEVLIAALEMQISAHRAFVGANAVQGMAVQGIAENTPAQVAGAQSQAMMPPQQPGEGQPAQV